MKKLLYILLLSLACCSGDNGPKYLFVIQSKGGEIEKLDDEYYLKMIDTNPKVIQFTDRPYHDASFIPLTSLLDIWDKGEDNFKVDPPNASLSALFTDKENGKQALHIVEILDPQYDPKTKTLKFKMVSIHDQLPLNEVKIEKVALFIDHMSL